MSGLTKSLLTLTREQRHLAMRVIICTQGTSPSFSTHDVKASFIIPKSRRLYHPSSWTFVLLPFSTDSHQRLGGIISQTMYRLTSQMKRPLIGLLDWRQVIRVVARTSLLTSACVQTGQAIVLAPSGLGVFKGTLSSFGRRYLFIKTRKRVTVDSGASILVLDE